MTPSLRWRASRTDYFGNVSDFFAVIAPQERLEVTPTSEVEIAPRPPLPAADATRAVGRSCATRSRYRSGARYGEAAEFVFASPLRAARAPIAAYARPHASSPGRPLLDGRDRPHAAHPRRFPLRADATDADDAGRPRLLEQRKGVCQDFAHLMIACLRSLGLPARYVSGYLLTAPPPGRPRLVGADASHAWVQVYVPEAGWIDFDPTNGVIPDGQHVTLAWGRDYGDVSPLRGVIVGGTGHALKVAVTVTPI